MTITTIATTKPNDPKSELEKEITRLDKEIREKEREIGFLQEELEDLETERGNLADELETFVED